MKNNLLVIFIFLFAVNTFSQNASGIEISEEKTKSKFTYLQYDFTLALKVNPDAGETDARTQEKESWFLPDGLGTKIGYGLHYNNWVALGIHTGINWEWENKLVVVPVFANFRLSPKIGDDTRIVLQTGIGKAGALGRGSLSGDYKKLSLGIQSDTLLLFVEISQYDFPINDQENSGNISLGLAFVQF
jgi:hypothetical protein